MTWYFGKFLGRLPAQIAFFSIPLALVACSGSSTLDDAIDERGVPGWVNSGTNISKAQRGRLFHGVGSAPMLGDFSLQTTTADKQARAEVSRILTSYMEIVSRDFIASGDAEEVGFTEQNVARQIEALSRMTLPEAAIVGHWRDRGRRVIYAIAELDMQQAFNAMTNLATMHEGLRNYIDSEGRDIFDRIAQVEVEVQQPSASE